MSPFISADARISQGSMLCNASAWDVVQCQCMNLCPAACLPACQCRLNYPSYMCVCVYVHCFFKLYIYVTQCFLEYLSSTIQRKKMTNFRALNSLNDHVRSRDQVEPLGNATFSDNFSSILSDNLVFFFELVLHN